MPKRFVIATFILLSINGTVGHTQPTKQLSLPEAIRAALNHDAQYLAAIATRDAGIEKEQIGFGGLLPSVTATYNVYPDSTTLSRYTNSSLAGNNEWLTTRYNYQTRAILLRQPLIRLRNWATYLQGKSQAEQAQARLEFDRTMAITRLIETYGNWLLAEKRVAATKTSVNYLAEKAAQARAMRTTGHASATDALQAEAEAQKVRHDLAEAEREFAFLSERFVHLVGEPARPGPLAITPRAESLEPRLGFDELKQKVLRQNPEIRALEQAVEAARWELKKNQADHTPTLDFVTNYSEESNASAVLLGRETKTTTMGFQLTIPIYQGGIVNSTIRQASADFRRVQAELTAGQHRVSNDLARVYTSLRSAQELYLYSQKQLDFAQENLQSVLDQRQLGFKTSVDQLQAEELVATSLTGKAAAISLWMAAKSSLLALLGETESIENNALEILFQTQ